MSDVAQINNKLKLNFPNYEEFIFGTHGNTTKSVVEYYLDKDREDLIRDQVSVKECSFILTEFFRDMIDGWVFTDDNGLGVKSSNYEIRVDYISGDKTRDGFKFYLLDLDNNKTLSEHTIVLTSCPIDVFSSFKAPSGLSDLRAQYKNPYCLTRELVNNIR